MAPKTKKLKKLNTKCQKLSSSDEIVRVIVREGNQGGRRETTGKGFVLFRTTYGPYSSLRTA